MVDFVGNWDDDDVIEHLRIKLELEVRNCSNIYRHRRSYISTIFL